MKKIIILLFILIIPLVLAEEIYLYVGDFTTHNGKTIRLENVGSGGAIVIRVDGITMTLSSGSIKEVNGIVISNLETYYEDNKEQRSALLDISTMNELCSNGKKDSINEEIDVDCGGPYCSACETCDDNLKNQDETDIDCGGSKCNECGEGKQCNSNSDCKSRDCYEKECRECEYFGKPICKTDFLVELGEDKKGCFLGYICCGDNVCGERENKDNCFIDCKVCTDKDKDGYKAGDCNEDCNDNDPEVHKFAKEICFDNKDNNCNDKIDENCEKEDKKNTKEKEEKLGFDNGKEIEQKEGKGNISDGEEIVVISKKEKKPIGIVSFILRLFRGLFR